MTGVFFTKHEAMFTLLALSLSIGGVLAADLNGVTITHDQDVAARTNMLRNPTETSTLGVTFDKDVAKRTNMQRDSGEVSPVKVIQDAAVIERTNMGDTARKSAKPNVVQTGSK